MKDFSGFPARMEFTAIPNVFFSGLLPEIDDMAELKTTLYVIALLYRKKGYPRYVSRAELLGDTVLMNGLRGGEGNREEALRRGLESAVGRGTLLTLRFDRDGAAEDMYFLNDKAGREAVAKIESGELKLAEGRVAARTPVAAEEPPDIFTLYEQNIGLLTPMIADELRDAESHYTRKWVSEAIKEAVLSNKRSINFIKWILEKWSVEGKVDGTHQRDFKTTDPDKYIKGKYGHMVQH
jgi:DNA replication protein